MKSFAKILSATAVAGTVLTACGGTQINKNMKLASDVDTLSYAFGALMGYQFCNNDTAFSKELEVNLNYQAFLAGLQASVDSDTTAMAFKTPQEANIAAQEIIGRYQEKKMAKDLEKGKAFLEENSKKEGVVTLENGLQYQILEEGTGEKPEATDTVLCDYAGTLIDGTEFDSSIKRGQPAKFPLNGVIQGWTELIPMMPKGSKWRLFIPAEYGYGQRAQAGIPANSVLIFDVTLIDIFKGVKPAEK